ncbi:hypothetical protein OPQ81_002516 [Rhizoctonia solani]|nr:hypothetical protein OPQ81_002516 [Rhizoctonia solani]
MVLDGIGTDLGCVAMHPTVVQMVVGKKEALHIHGPSVHDRSYAYEGEETAAYIHGHYIITIFSSITATPDSSRLTARTFAGHLFDASARGSRQLREQHCQRIEECRPGYTRFAVLDAELAFFA